MNMQQLQNMSKEAKMKFYRVQEAKQNLESLLKEFSLFEYMEEEDINALEDSIFNVRYNSR